MVSAMIVQASQGGWEAAGHANAFGWTSALGAAGLVLLVLAFALLVVRALVQRRRYRAVDVLTESELAGLREALAAAERRTVGEIVAVVLERSDRHPAAEWIAALLFALAGSALLAAWLPWDRPGWLLLCQLGLGLVGFLTARALPGFKRAFVSEARATEMTEEQALQEFYGQGLHRTEERTGVLLFVSLFERRAVVLGDEGIDRLVGAEHWQRTDEAILAGVRAGSLHDGLLAGIRACADVLAEHFPWREGDRNEVPDRIVVRRE